MAQSQGFTLFETPVGACAIAWGERGIIGVSLPSGGESPLQLLLSTGGPRVSGYTVEIFYP